MSVSSGDGHASGAFANQVGTRCYPSTLRLQGAHPNFAPRLLKGCYKGLDRIEGNWKLKGKIKENGGPLRMMISIDRWTPRAA